MKNSDVCPCLTQQLHLNFPLVSDLRVGREWRTCKISHSMLHDKKRVQCILTSQSYSLLFAFSSPPLNLPPFIWRTWPWMVEYLYSVWPWMVICSKSKPLPWAYSLTTAYSCRAHWAVKKSQLWFWKGRGVSIQHPQPQMLLSSLFNPPSIGVGKPGLSLLIFQTKKYLCCS